MKRSLAVLAVIVMAAAACSAHPTREDAQRVALPNVASFSYTGAFATGTLGVSLAPRGSSTAFVIGTSTVGATLFAAGQGYQVRIDGRSATRTTLPNCRCFKKVSLAKGLDAKPHVVTMVNLGSTDLIVHVWYVDHAGRFWYRAVLADPPTPDAVPPGADVSFYVRDTSAISVDTAPGPVEFDVHVDDRPVGYRVTIAKDQRRFGDIVRTPIAWGMASGIEHVTISVISGTLRLRHIVLMQLPRSHPQLLADAEALRGPLVAVLGDDTANGERSLGFQQDSDGFAADLASLRGWRLWQQTVPGATASCYGRKHIADVAATHPSAIIVSFGSNDLHPARGSPPCSTSLDSYRAAMREIIDALHLALPETHVYVQSILPSTTVSKTELETWNAALRKLVIASGARFIDPDEVLFPKFDYADLPNNRGHAKIARYWNTTIPGTP